MNRAAEDILARTEDDSAAAEGADVVDGGLHGAVAGADDVGVFGADGDRQAFVPVRFDSGVERCGAGAVTGGGRRPWRGPETGDASGECGGGGEEGAAQSGDIRTFSCGRGR